MAESRRNKIADRPTGTLLVTVGGFAAAFAAASCCGLPLLLSTLGIGGAWLTGLALLAAPNRLLLLAIGAIGLAGGGTLLWRQSRRAACMADVRCTRPLVQRTVLLCLILGLVLLYLGAAYA